MTIADLCKKYNVICVSDEVYEWVIFDGYKHVRICSLPGMWERTITISSGGKIFSVSGWKVGWAFSGSDLISNLLLVHQDCVSSCPTPIQVSYQNTSCIRGFCDELFFLGSDCCCTRKRIRTLRFDIMFLCCKVN